MVTLGTADLINRDTTRDRRAPHRCRHSFHMFLPCRSIGHRSKSTGTTSATTPLVWNRQRWTGRDQPWRRRVPDAYNNSDHCAGPDSRAEQGRTKGRCIPKQRYTVGTRTVKDLVSLLDASGIVVAARHGLTASRSCQFHGLISMSGY